MDHPTNPSTSSPWFGVATGLIGLIVGYGLSSSLGGSVARVPSAPPAAPSAPSAPAAAEDPMANAQPADIDDDAVYGDENATVTIIEFTDYQCPFCSRHFTDTLSQLKTNYLDNGLVKYVVRDYPLSFHANAKKAAEASECAGEQDGFWEMHDVLFAKQGEWSNVSDPSANFKQYASELGLNATTFGSCLDNGDMAAEVDADFAAGNAAGVSGTPGFWIISAEGETKAISGAYPYQTFADAIDAML